MRTAKIAAAAVLAMAGCGGGDEGGTDVDYPTPAKAFLADDDPYCGAADSKEIDATTEWYWFRHTGPRRGRGVHVCAGSSPNGRRWGVLYFFRDSSEGPGDRYVIVVPDSGSLRIAGAPRGVGLPVADLEYANLGIRAEDGRRGTLRIMPPLDEYRLDLQGEIFSASTDLRRAVFPEQIGG